MNDMDVVSIISLLGWLVLVSMGFASFKLSWGKTAQLALVWLAVFWGFFFFLRFLWLGF